MLVCINKTISCWFVHLLKPINNAEHLVPCQSFECSVNVHIDSLFVVYVWEFHCDRKLNCLVFSLFLSLQVRCGHLFSSLSSPKNSCAEQALSNSKFFTLHFYILTILEQSVGLSVSLSAYNGFVIITCWSLFCVSDDCLRSLCFLLKAAEHKFNLVESTRNSICDSLYLRNLTFCRVKLDVKCEKVSRDTSGVDLIVKSGH